MRAALLSIVLAVATVAMPVSAQAIAQSYHLNIPRQPLDGALKDLAQQTGLQIARFSDTPGGSALVGPVSGDMSIGQALTSLLTASGLTYKIVNDRTIAVMLPGADSGAARSTQASGSNQASPPTSDNGKEGKKSSSGDFRVAQVDQGQASSPSTVEEQGGQPPKKKAVLEEVVVTGSRIPTTAKDGVQDVKIYAREQIEQSGQTTVADFLSTLPNVSVASTENQIANGLAATTVQLRGLPQGATLVLINGRRIETSGSQATNDFFDLNNVPLAAVERIEVVADGSSAIYGSDAIAGVVNITLKKDFDGFEVAATHGVASGTDETDAYIAWGKHWNKGSFSIIGNYQTRDELNNSARSLTASNDYTAYGGPDNNLPTCNPGNVFSADGITPLPGLGAATYAAVPAGFKGSPSIQEFAATAGKLNTCAVEGSAAIFPATNRFGTFAVGDYQLTSSVDLFTEFMYSHVEQFVYTVHPDLFGEPGFQFFTVSPSNPHNPFGTTVGISDVFTSLPRQGELANTNFVRGLIGARGTLFDRWQWEVSAWDSRDSTDNPQPLAIANNTAIQNALNSANPATALNPFVAGPPGPLSQLQSFYSDGRATYMGEGQVINGFARGSLLRLPAGSVAAVLGAEFERDTLSSDQVNTPSYPPNTQYTYHRDSYAVFGEARVPLLASHTRTPTGDMLAVTLAGRHDHYGTFGSANTPQLGAELRPTGTILVRATYAKAFKAPSLVDLYSPQLISQQPIMDPATGQTYLTDVITGGDPHLVPQTGQSHTVGLVYASDAIPDLKVSVTQWQVNESNVIENNLSLNVILDNPSLFPGDVTRPPNCSSGPPCPITQIDALFVNFGSNNVAGLDYQINYRAETAFGTWLPSLGVSQTYRYYATLTPGTPPTDRVSRANDDGNWAPRWKGTAALGWNQGLVAANLDGRYVSSYQDYDSTRLIGNRWLCDANLRYALGHAFTADSRWLKSTYLEVGAVNVFNKLPQFSNYAGGFLGYDPSQSDIRGRFVYLRLGGKM